MTTTEPTFEHRSDAHRYELLLDGEVVGNIGYRDDGERRVVLHTKVDDAYTGRGYGTRLIEGALDDIRASGMRGVMLCSMAAAYVAKHRDYDDIVDPPHVLDRPDV